MFLFYLFSFWTIINLKQIQKYTHYIIVYNVGRAALEQAYRSLCKRWLDESQMTQNFTST